MAETLTPPMSDDDLYGICEIIGDTYAGSLMVPCPDCKGSGTIDRPVSVSDICKALLVQAGARTNISDLPGNPCQTCDGVGKVRDEKHACHEAMRVARKWYPDLFGEAPPIREPEKIHA